MLFFIKDKDNKVQKAFNDLCELECNLQKLTENHRSYIAEDYADAWLIAGRNSENAEIFFDNLHSISGPVWILQYHADYLAFSADTEDSLIDLFESISSKLKCRAIDYLLKSKETFCGAY